MKPTPRAPASQVSQASPAPAPVPVQAPSARLRPRTTALELRVSVVVPCAAKHVSALPELLRALSNQTRRPQEVVLAVSGCDSVPRSTGTHAGLDVKLTHVISPAYAGANRNRGCDLSTGDVIVFQDADDLPHPQRVEILAAMFEKYEVDHVLHTFSRGKIEPKSFNLDVALRSASYRFPFAKDAKLTNGNLTISRAAARSLRFDEALRRGQDSVFNQKIYPMFRSSTAVIRLPLILYRQHLSTMYNK